jgi:hypothetical protein
MKSKHALLTALLFVLLNIFGISIALHKPLWLDELQTQYYTTQNLPWDRVLIGKNQMEGNNAPLYYLTQKWVNAIPGTSVTLQDRLRLIHADPKQQVVLRLTAILAVSAAIAFLFFFFLSRFSGSAAIFLVFSALTSPMVWLYWAEARPYPFIILFATLQAVLLFRMTEGKPASDGRSWLWLFVIQLLLVFTSYLNAVLIVAGGAVLVLFGERRWRLLAAACGIPLAVALFYRAQGLHDIYEIGWDLVFLLDNIPPERLAFIGIGLLSLVVSRYGRKDILTWKGSPALQFLPHLVIVLAGAVMLLAVIWLNYHMNKAFFGPGLPGRMFTYLTPIGIIMQVLVFEEMRRDAARDWWLIGQNVLLVALLACVGTANVLTEVAIKIKFL